MILGALGLPILFRGLLVADASQVVRAGRDEDGYPGCFALEKPQRNRPT
jgi:hypothetical protein